MTRPLEGQRRSLERVMNVVGTASRRRAFNIGEAWLKKGSGLFKERPTLSAWKVGPLITTGKYHKDGTLSRRTSRHHIKVVGFGLMGRREAEARRRRHNIS